MHSLASNFDRGPYKRSATSEPSGGGAEIVKEFTKDDMGTNLTFIHVNKYQLS